MTWKRVSERVVLASVISLGTAIPFKPVSTQQLADVRSLVRYESQITQGREEHCQAPFDYMVELGFTVKSEGKNVSNPTVTSSKPILIGDVNREFAAVVNLQRDSGNLWENNFNVTVSTATTIVKELKKGEEVANGNYTYKLDDLDKNGNGVFSIRYRSALVEKLTARRGNSCMYGGGDNTLITIYNLADRAKPGSFRFAYQTGFQPIIPGETIDCGFSYQIIFNGIFKPKDTI